MSHETTSPAKTSTTKRLRIDFLFLDLTTCTRCRATDRSLGSALELVGARLAVSGTKIEVNKVQVESAEQARKLRLVSSPTLRINGRDLALELRESSCGSGACIDGCGEAIACRVWVHRGREYTAPPVAMIMDAITREVHGEAVVERDAEAEPYELPENLDRFFAAKAAAEAAKSQDPGPSCCSPAERQTCCEASEKAECCGPSAEGCGCR